MYNDSVVKLILKDRELLENEETTYNFEVEDFHTYYVGEMNILLHNICDGNIKADLGRKAEYAFGNATGDSHNIIRSHTNATELRKIGIYDDFVERKIFSDHFQNVFKSNH